MPLPFFYCRVSGGRACRAQNMWRSTGLMIPQPTASTCQRAMSNQQTGLLILAVAAFVAVIGVLVWSGALAWFGKLPGDVRIERGSARIYIPITSMLLLSLVATLVINLIRRLF